MGTRRHHFRDAGGTALVEILVVLVVIAIGIGSIESLFPLGLLKLRHAADESRAALSLRRLADAAWQFQLDRGASPHSLVDLTSYLAGDPRYADGEDGGYLFVLDGTRLTAVPAAPGKTGVRHFCVTVGDVYDCTSAAAIRLARANEQRMRRGLMLSAATAVVELLESDESNSARTLLYSYAQAPAVKLAAFNWLDGNHDGLVTLRELSEIAEPKTPLGRFFEQAMIHLELGAGDEDLDTLPGVGFSVVAGDPTRFFSVPPSDR